MLEPIFSKLFKNCKICEKILEAGKVGQETFRTSSLNTSRGGPNHLGLLGLFWTGGAALACLLDGFEFLEVFADFGVVFVVVFVDF